MFLYSLCHILENKMFHPPPVVHDLSNSFETYAGISSYLHLPSKIHLIESATGEVQLPLQLSNLKYKGVTHKLENDENLIVGFRGSDVYSICH